MKQLIEAVVNQWVENLLPYGAGMITEHRLRYALSQVAQRALTLGEDHALSSLMDISDALEEVNRRLSETGRRPISKRRLQAIARAVHDRWGVGFPVTGTGAWLFRPEEIDALVPGKPGRRKK